jgi:putative membrane protein
MADKPLSRLRRVPLLRMALLAGGIALFVWLVVATGVEDLLAGLAAVGWGLALIVAYRFLPLSVHTLGWRAVIPGPPPPLLPLLWIRWICESVNSLLPVAQVGGELVRARLLAARGLAAPLAGASVVVDFSIGMMAQLVFTLVGVLALPFIVGFTPTVWSIMIAVVGAGFVLALFVFSQHKGMFGFGAGLVAKLARSQTWQRLAGNARRLDRAVRGLYGRRPRVRRDFLLRLLAWFLGTGETWLAFYFMGQPVGVVEAVIIESLGFAVRSLGFAVPGAIGVLEGGFVLIGLMLGIDPSAALTLALVKRLREVILGIPALVGWLIQEAVRPAEQTGDTRTGSGAR